ncbi:MAG TPA: EI24 domain-containing protein [Stellaceae bacterium]
MLTALRLAIADALRPEQRRAIVISMALALVLLLALWLGITTLLHEVRVAGIGWLDTLIEVLGSLAALVLAWVLFPAVTLLVLGFFLDRVVSAAERRHYPDLPPARRIGIGEAVASAARILLLALVANLAALPFYMFPVINLFIYYGLNGYLVGREYFELVALRRVDGAAARAMWRWHRGGLVLAGVVIVLLLSLPLVNLAAPVVAAAFMLHVFEGLRRGGRSKFSPRAAENG